jgi:ribosome-associated protein
MKNTGSKFKKVAIEAARLGDSKHAENIVVYEMTKNSTLADYAVLMTADSAPQLEAVEEAVNKAFKEQGLYVLYREGGESRAWKVLDYGGVLVHIFETRAREFYSMDALYSPFPQVAWRPEAAGQKPAVKKTAPAAKKKAGVKNKAGAKAKAGRKPAAAKRPAAPVRKKSKPVKRSSRKK